MTSKRIKTLDGFMRYQLKVLSDYESGEIDRKLPTNKELKEVLKLWRGKICIEFCTNAHSLVVQVIKSDFFDEMAHHWPDEEPARVSISIVNYHRGFLVLTPL